MADAFDAIIIGGGVIGAATLFHLTRSGCRNPLLLEQGEIAGGMTAHSSGIVRTHYSVPINVQVARASLAMFEDFSALLDDDEADAGLVRSGYIIVAPPGPASGAVRASIAMQRALGVDAALVDRSEALQRHPGFIWTTSMPSASRRRQGSPTLTWSRQASFARPVAMARRSGPIHKSLVFFGRVAVSSGCRPRPGWSMPPSSFPQ